MSFAYLPLYTGDYFRDTRGLSMAGHGCYLLLLTYCWDSKGPLPLDEERVAGICEARSQEERRTMQHILATYFTRMDDGWYNSRMQREIERCNAISNVRTEAGRRGANERMRLFRDNNVASAKQVLGKCLASAKQVTLTSSPSPSPRKATPKTKVGAFAPPDWVPQAEWEAFDEMRKARSGKAWTLRARELAIAKLQTLQDLGYAPAAVLTQSVERSWSGLFPVDRGSPRAGRSAAGRQRTVADARREVAEAIFGTGKGDDDPITGTAERLD